MMSQKVDILLAEDNEDDANLIIRALKPYLRSELIWLKDGLEVLDFFKTRKETLPKVILLDLKMPKLGGLEVLKEIKSLPLLKNIPIVILTSSQENRDLQGCYDLGANSYVVKPIDFNQLMDVTKGLGQYWLELNESLA